jgi:hypothetical protein
LLKGLLRARGKPTDLALTPQVEFESALALGDVWALDQLWKELGFEGLARIKRLIVVADRGLVSLDNVDELRKVMLPNGQALEFIVAVPGRRYGEFAPILKDFQGGVAGAKEEVLDEARWNELRLVIAHHPEQAQEQTKLRRQRIDGGLPYACQHPRWQAQRALGRYRVCTPLPPACAAHWHQTHPPLRRCSLLVARDSSCR